MRRHKPFLFLAGAVFTLTFSVTSIVIAQSLQRISFVPQTSDPTTCNSTSTRGSLYFASTTGELKVCTNGSWTAVGSGTGTNYLTLSGSSLYPTSTGYVFGIGTTTPAYGLTVVGTSYFSQPVIVGTPTLDTHAATKSYVDSAISASSTNYWALSGNTLYPISTSYKIGIGTTTPAFPLVVIGDTSGAAVGPLVLKTVTAGSIGTAVTLDSTLSTNGRKYSFISTGEGATGGAGNFAIFDGTASAYRFFLTSSSWVGINTSTILPAAPIDVYTANSADQARAQQWSYSGGSSAYYLRLKTTVTAGVVRWTFDQLNNSIAYNNVFTFDRGMIGIATTSPSSRLTIKGSSTSASDSSLNITNSNDASLFFVRNDGNIGIASSTPGYNLAVTGTGYFSQPVFVGTPTQNGHAATKAYVDGAVGGGAYWTLATSTLQVTSSTYDVSFGDGIGTDLIVGSGAGKIDVGTVDPVYTIGGKRYATYMAGMTGVKEETTGVLRLKCKDESSVCSTVINFGDLDEGSDLWLFAKTTNLVKNFKAMTVLLTPSFNGNAWYEKDANNLHLTIYGSIAGEISYRFTAPRFDSEVWGNKSSAEYEGFNLDNLIFSDGAVDIKSLIRR